MDITRSEFTAAVKILLGVDEYERTIARTTEASISFQCDAVARAMLLGEIASDDSSAVQIVRETARRLMRGDGTHGLIA
ncbi:hypothetical protein [Burkholderia pseudomallei]|uniref:hypothetical protein n=1 Tax=Burkholderia pseudomallei TaxID=28450 RepID=UPI000A1A0D52|nr:hypothetical protein [Burkholderia pseudomallei]ARL38844.1 hypothetical protein BOC49_21555 [Burkholderia pseudomallei]